MNRSLLLVPLLVATACSSSSDNGGGTGDAATDVTEQSDSSMDATNDVTSNDATTDATNDTVTANDVANDVPTTTNDAAADGGSGEASSDASNDASEAAAPVTLTINDYLSWCNVTVNGSSPSTGSLQTYPFAPNTSVTVQGDTANAGAFYWGYWGNVASDGGLADGGEDLGMTVTFNITRDMTLNACCPDNGQPLTQCTF